MTDLDKIIADNFSMSHAEARRLIGQGGVRREDGSSIGPDDEVKDGEQIRVGRNRMMTINKEDN